MKNPLRKRYLRDLRQEFGKYLVIFLFITLTIAFISGFLVADGSMRIAYDQSFEKYNIEDGHFTVTTEGGNSMLQMLMNSLINDSPAEEWTKNGWIKDLKDMDVAVYENKYMDEEMKVDAVIGLTHEELRAQSHNPMKYYNIKQMVLPDYTMGTEYAMLNKLRTSIRETEVAACQAFHDGKKYIRTDIIEELNRLSSALHIMMCRHLAGWYSEDGGNE